MVMIPAETLAMTELEHTDRLAAVRAENKRLRTALEQIERWDGFPETGAFWDREKTRPVSYEAQYGSNGARDFMRGIARAALTAGQRQDQS